MDFSRTFMKNKHTVITSLHLILRITMLQSDKNYLKIILRNLLTSILTFIGGLIESLEIGTWVSCWLPITELTGLLDVLNDKVLILDGLTKMVDGVVVVVQSGVKLGKTFECKWTFKSSSNNTVFNELPSTFDFNEWTTWLPADDDISFELK